MNIQCYALVTTVLSYRNRRKQQAFVGANQDDGAKCDTIVEKNEQVQARDHSYGYTCAVTECNRRLANLAVAITKKNEEIRKLQERIEVLDLQKPRMRISLIEEDAEKVMVQSYKLSFDRRAIFFGYSCMPLAWMDSF